MHCSLIKEFEQEARIDNMPAAELTSRKKGMVQQLNEYIGKKKELGSDIAGRKELIGAAKRGDAPSDYNGELALALLPCCVHHRLAAAMPEASLQKHGLTLHV